MRFLGGFFGFLRQQRGVFRLWLPLNSQLAYTLISFKLARLQEENRDLKSKVNTLTESNGAGIPLDLSREFEQRVKRLEAELEVSEDQRRKAAQEVVKLQSQLSESQHAAMGHKEVLVSEVGRRLLTTLYTVG